MKPRASSGQVMVLLAMLIPLVLLPVAGYAVEAAYAVSRESLLEWACSRAAEDAAQVIDPSALRSQSALRVNPIDAFVTAHDQVLALDPRAVVDTVGTSGTTVTVYAHEDVPATLAFWIPSGHVRVNAVASARLTPGYSSPSSALPFSTSSLAVASALSSSAASSSRHLEGWMNG